MLKILHVASFSGNVGDNINHAGSYRMLAHALGVPFTAQAWEIRKYFWRQANFDHAFADLCNNHDFVLFGGGNYFELWVERSASGTSVDIPLDVLEKIKVPIVFHSLGCDAAQGYTESSLRKTKSYFEALLARRGTFISLRNDGSMETARKLLGSSISQQLHLFPDGGFFAADPSTLSIPDSNGRVVIGINIAGDMLSHRFGSESSAIHTFYEEFATFINRIAEERSDLHFRFFPHIFRDFHPLAAILDHIADSVRRCRVEVAPLLVGSSSASALLQQYAECSLVLGNRFHANVCPIGLKVPTIGLVNYPQVQFLYEELGLIDRSVHLTDPRIGEKLGLLAGSSLDTMPALQSRYADVADTIAQTGKREYAGLARWLKAHL